MARITLLVAIIAVTTLSNSKAAGQIPNCLGVTNGFMFSNTLVPNEFYLCDDSIPIPMMCPSNMVFCSVGSVQGCLQSCASLAMSALCTQTTTVVNSNIPTAPTPINSGQQSNSGNIPTAPTVGNPGQNPAINIPAAPTASYPGQQNVGNGGEPCTTEGLISGVAGTCSGYSMCLNGKTVIGTCSGNMMFNGATGTCSETVCA